MIEFLNSGAFMNRLLITLIFSLGLQCLQPLAMACDADHQQDGFTFLALDEYGLFSKIDSINQKLPAAGKYLFDRIQEVKVCQEDSLEDAGDDSSKAFKEGKDASGNSGNLIVAVALTQKTLSLNRNLVLDEKAVLLFLQVIAQELVQGDDVAHDTKVRKIVGILNKVNEMDAKNFSAKLLALGIDFPSH
jgi:hypothetical protein